ncbi:hypothetical protein SUGI_1401580 [Cryptomeria japonica]|uniref:Uncharacterized protein n=1 Tax=Cryptomeria japonica TaxID=3369 RepID=A0AAD3RQF2_CRYJA|nr:hypothetical protein SUGI_1279220 [Cryptomeria japonica]GLJ56983.1 hypothetical protein SUGI_1279330 [Cryptomeria japonica]GLJ57253.1 hypothetical protein SUGI_1307590 [Cryptomeria japonica]GLJ57263.1 hypothetical protein SUGI_1307700 [Cryptomeria japonica]GLJ58013.1 hypothetical protein SUGI_1401580 [Cryptomeria japonica]
MLILLYQGEESEKESKTDPTAVKAPFGKTVYGVTESMMNPPLPFACISNVPCGIFTDKFPTLIPSTER